MPNSSVLVITMSSVVLLDTVVLVVVAVVVIVVVAFISLATTNDGAEHAKRDAGSHFTVVDLAVFVDPDTPLAAVAEALAPPAFIAMDATLFELTPVVEGLNAGLPAVAEAHAASAPITDHDGGLLDGCALRKRQRQRVRIWRRQARQAKHRYGERKQLQ